MKVKQAKAALAMGIKVFWGTRDYLLVNDQAGYRIVRIKDGASIVMDDEVEELSQFYPEVLPETLLAAVDDAGSEISAHLAIEDLYNPRWRFVAFAAEDLNLEPAASRYWVMVCGSQDNNPVDYDVAVELAIDLLQEKGLINETVTASIVI